LQVTKTYSDPLT